LPRFSQQMWPAHKTESGLCSTAGQRIMVAAGDLVLPPDTMEGCLVLLVIESKSSVSKKEGI
jgi:hypothetical protein